MQVKLLLSLVDSEPRNLLFSGSVAVIGKRLLSNHRIPIILDPEMLQFGVLDTELRRDAVLQRVTVRVRGWDVICSGGVCTVEGWSSSSDVFVRHLDGQSCGYHVNFVV